MPVASTAGVPAINGIKALNGKPEFPRRNTEPFVRDVLSGKERLRGVMVLLNNVGDDYELARQDLVRLKREYGANHIRLYFNANTGLLPHERRRSSEWIKGDVYRDSPEWYKVTGEIFKRRWIPLFRELDLPIILMMSATMPAGLYQTPDAALWRDKSEQARLVESVVGLAEFFKDEEMVIGYDLINEPIPPGCTSEGYQHKGYKFWWTYSTELARQQVENGDRILADLYNRMIARIRTFSKDKIIVLEPGPWGTPRAYPALLDVVDDPRLIFSHHHCDPHPFATYGMKAWTALDASLLAKEEGKQFYPNRRYNWDRGLIAASFEEAVAFQKAREKQTGRHCVIWIGEFGAQRFSDESSQSEWFTDSLEVMEGLGFGWALFVYDAGVSVWWANYSPRGPVGKAVDIPAFFTARKELNVGYFKRLRSKGLRPEFGVLVEYMKRNQSVE